MSWVASYAAEEAWVVEQARLVIQLALGWLFLLSFGGKLRDPAAFLRGVDEYALLPRWAAYALGGLLLPLEGFLAASLLSGWSVGAAVPLTVAALALFLVAVSINLTRERRMPCHCMGGAHDEQLSGRTALRLVLLLAGALFLAAEPSWMSGEPTRWTLSRVAGVPDLLHAAMLALLVLVTGGWALRARELWMLSRSQGDVG